ncbi:MAG: hypothetical protein EPO21_19105 [Chloroflexota bacterium]|nr:MAG: hypothetical protein EPO21_19105 [Chloroflexota bacterium]
MQDFHPDQWYRIITSADVSARQGDQLFDLSIPIAARSKSDPQEYDVVEYFGNFIIVTQSCDLKQRKLARVEVAMVYSLSRYLSFNPSLLADLDSIRSGETHRYYLLPAWPDAPFDQLKEARVVEFDHKFSISWDELDVGRRGDRVGLRSPYIEHFGQAVARFYMRVGLPEDMPPFTAKKDPAHPPLERRLTNDDIAGVDIRQLGYHPGRLPMLSHSLDVVVHKMRFPGHPDVLYKAMVKQRGNYSGVAADADGALQSLAGYLVRKHAEAERGVIEGEDAQWLLSLFGSSSS